LDGGSSGGGQKTTVLVDGWEESEWDDVDPLKNKSMV